MYNIYILYNIYIMYIIYILYNIYNVLYIYDIVYIYMICIYIYIDRMYIIAYIFPCILTYPLVIWPMKYVPLTAVPVASPSLSPGLSLGPYLLGC